MQPRDYSYYRQVFAALSKPFAYVDLDYFDANAAALAQRAKDKPIRVASKSVRCLSLLKRVLALPQYQGIMCFTAAEAVWLSQQGLDDLLVAYPTTDQNHLRAVAQEVAQGKTIYLMTDQVAHLERIDAIGKEVGVRLPICLDLDLSMRLPGLHFGVFRSSIVDVKTLNAYLDALPWFPQVQLRALMGYEAQIAGVGDQSPNKPLYNQALRFLQERSRKQVAERRAQAVQLIKDRGIVLDFVNGGGTGSLESTTAEEAVTEVTAGSGLFSPTLFDGYRQFQHWPAVGYAIEIVRQPMPDVYTCLGGGYMASGAVGPEKAPQPHLPKGCTLIANEGAGEVQTPIQYKGKVPLTVGDPIFMRHAKAGELCERFEHLHAVQDGALIGAWPTYRGQGQCFL